MNGPSTDDKGQIFEGLRPRLLGLAYRMLGTLAEAEDVVQEAYLRFHGRTDVEDPRRWLVSVTTRIAIDHLRRVARGRESLGGESSGRKSYRREGYRREGYKGPWLPEPVATDEPSPFASTALADDLSIAFLALLERLAPAERAAFLLREVFDYPYSELASMLEKNEDACRQLVSRARRRIRQERPRFQPDHQAHRRLAEEFVRAAKSGDLSALEQALHDDVVLVGDGGGKVASALHPIFGVDKVRRFFLGVLPKQPQGTLFELREINGLPGICATVGGEPLQTISFDLVEGLVRAIYIVRNPDKLTRLRPAGPRGRVEPPQ